MIDALERRGLITIDDGDVGLTDAGRKLAARQ